MKKAKQVMKKSEENFDFGERVREIRKRNSLTQDEFAKKLGVTRNTIFLIEKGNPCTHSTIVKIADTFNVDLNWLILGESIKNDAFFDSKPIERIEAPGRNAFQEMLRKKDQEIEFLRGVVEKLLQGAKVEKLKGLEINMPGVLEKGHISGPVRCAA